VSNFVLNFLQKKGIRTVPHPPYSLNLAHCNFHLFPELNKISAANDLQLRMHCGYSIIWHTIRTWGPNHPSSVPWEEHICVRPNISQCCMHTSLITFLTVFIHYMFKSCDSLPEKKKHNDNKYFENISCGLDTKCQKNSENYTMKIFIVWACHPFLSVRLIQDTWYGLRNEIYKYIRQINKTFNNKVTKTAYMEKLHTRLDN
jgi:hypothetical protein